MSSFRTCAWAILLLATVALGSKQDKMIDWLVSKGGKVGFRIRRECPDCPLAAVAAARFWPGEVVARVHYACTLLLRQTAPFAATQAHELALMLRRDPKVNYTMAPYFAALPKAREILSPVQYSDEELEMLQAPELAELILQRRMVADWLYGGDDLVPGLPEDVQSALSGLEPLAEALGRDSMSLAQFRHLAAVVSSRGMRIGKETVLVPAIDFVGYADDPNTQLSGNDEGYVLRATRHIEAGEVVTRSSGMVRRNDAALFHLGIVRRDEQPLLCGIDLPTYDPQQPWVKTPDDDDAHDPATGGAYATHEEFARLLAKLSALPTTEKEDEALLAGGSLKTRRQRVLVEFRLARKKAIRVLLEKMAKGLKKEYPTGGEKDKTEL